MGLTRGEAQVGKAPRKRGPAGLGLVGRPSGAHLGPAAAPWWPAGVGISPTPPGP